MCRNHRAHHGALSSLGLYWVLAQLACYSYVFYFVHTRKRFDIVDVRTSYLAEALRFSECTCSTENRGAQQRVASETSTGRTRKTHAAARSPPFARDAPQGRTRFARSHASRYCCKVCIGFL